MNCVIDDESPLYNAVENRNLDLAEFLVANGADVNQRVPDLGRGTVLHRACWVRNANFHFYRVVFRKSYFESHTTIFEEE